jgi:hypothetical protein
VPASFPAQFDSVWARYDRIYAEFDYKGVNWDSLRTVYRPSAVNATSEADLAAAVGAMLGALRDVHAWLTDPSGHVVATYQPSAFVNWRQDIWVQYLPRLGWHQVRPNLGFGTIGAVPYVAVGQWNPSQISVGAIDSIVDLFRNAPGFVIDVRMNGGGDESLAYAMAGRFYDVSHTAGYAQTRNGPRHSDLTPLTPMNVSPRGAWQFSKSVLVLSGRGCFSSTEGFLSAMQVLPNVTIAGDTSGGGSGNPEIDDLGGGWTYTIPRWLAYTANKQIVEWRGIAPSVRVNATGADFVAGADPVLDYAINWANGLSRNLASRR